MSKELTYLDAIREALAEEMRRDPKVFVLGEDVGPYGGAFGATQGLYDEFGEMRVVDTPISESAIIGISIGAALRGYRPVRAHREQGVDGQRPPRRHDTGEQRDDDEQRGASAKGDGIGFLHSVEHAADQFHSAARGGHPE